MGLDSRDYMQDDADGGGSVRAARGWFATLSAVGWLILLNVVVWVAWQVSPPSFYGAGPGPLGAHLTVSADGVLRHGRVWTLVTYAFSHVDLWHLLWNVLFLHWFGRDLEAIYGRRNTVALYLAAALAGGVAQVGWEQWRGTPGLPTLGASGAVMGFAVVATLFFPRREVRLWGIVPLPLWALTGIFVATDLLGVGRSLSTSLPDGVAHAAHLGGGVLGLVWQRLDLRPLRDDGPGLLGRLRALAPPRRAGRAAARPLDDAGLDPRDEVGAAGRVDAATAARVDALLEKIHTSGLPSLTAEERAFLDAASAKYRR